MAEFKAAAAPEARRKPDGPPPRKLRRHTQGSDFDDAEEAAAAAAEAMAASAALRFAAASGAPSPMAAQERERDGTTADVAKAASFLKRSAVQDKSFTDGAHDAPDLRKEQQLAEPGGSNDGGAPVVDHVPESIVKTTSHPITPTLVATLAATSRPSPNAEDEIRAIMEEAQREADKELGLIESPTPAGPPIGGSHSGAALSSMRERKEEELQQQQRMEADRRAKADGKAAQKAMGKVRKPSRLKSFFGLGK